MAMHISEGNLYIFYRTSIVWITKTGGYAVVCSSLKAESRKLSLIDSIQILTFDKRFFLK